MTNGLALDAIGDPTRRQLLLLLNGGEATVRELTDALPVSQSAVSQHLRVLREAHLVQVRPAGTRRLYSVDLNGLGEVRAWVDSFWDDALAGVLADVEVEHVGDSEDTEHDHGADRDVVDGAGLECDRVAQERADQDSAEGDSAAQ